MKKILKIAGGIYFFGGFMLLFGSNIYAYIDPSVTTYLIQAIAGVVIAVGVAVGMYIRKAKKKVYDKFGIDENKNKEVESDDIMEVSDDKTEN
jgi:hypothetical protein